MIKVLLVEDQALVRGALRALLEMEKDITIVAESDNGRNALDQLKLHAIDLVLSDIEMPEMNGIELAETLAEHHPEIKTVIVTTFGKAGYIKRALAAGVDGFILKDSPSDVLAEALRKVMQGKRHVDAELALMALDEKDPLSDKERAALKLAAEGKSTQAIADSLFLSVGTVRNYLSEASSKLNATNRIEAARIAQQKGWL